MDQIADWGAATLASTGHVMPRKAAVIWYRIKHAKIIDIGFVYSITL